MSTDEIAPPERGNEYDLAEFDDYWLSWPEPYQVPWDTLAEQRGDVYEDDRTA